MVRRLVRGAGVPLWRQLQDDLLERVGAGEFGEQFPGELVLAGEYGISRQTVRQALQRLRADGVVTAMRGRQPRIAPATEILQPMGALYSLFASVEAAGLAQHSAVRFFDVRADALVAERLGLEGSAPLVYLERVRVAGGEPLALDRVWLVEDVGRTLLGVDFRDTGLYRELAARAGVRLDHGREYVHAALPTAAERGLLRCPEGVAVFSINRLSSAGDKPVEWRHTVVRGDRFALTADFSSATGYRLALR
ncbi:GntR family transcriptional regulator [Actinophytocola sp.]|uniref:GntR family transcriptional regulator n=1 Tax=Actinophytocola sp. TaxID=1872138 RepID=UPI002D7F10A4|nr:GntR family transcriptional regulator [Actinophytocola sp.]HET9139959.1 GntR family transcriptional regulator [Actinophytocola sp.]HEU5110967.1 GntR family transcriptional regulator [Micromonosporaceae bacterium]